MKTLALPLLAAALLAARPILPGDPEVHVQAVSPDGRIVVTKEVTWMTLAVRQAMVAWDVGKKAPIGRMPIRDATNMSHASGVRADGKVLVQDGGGVFLWHPATGGRQGELAAAGRLTCASLSPDGKTLVTIRFWEYS